MSATSSAKRRKRRRILGIGDDATTIHTLPNIDLGQILHSGSSSTSGIISSKLRVADVITSFGCEDNSSNSYSPKVLQNIDGNNGNNRQRTSQRQRDLDESSASTNKVGSRKEKNGDTTKPATSPQKKKSMPGKSNGDRPSDDVSASLAVRQRMVFLETEISRLQAENRAKDKEIRCLKGTISSIKALISPIDTTMQSSLSLHAPEKSSLPKTNLTGHRSGESNKLDDSSLEVENQGVSICEQQKSCCSEFPTIHEPKKSSASPYRASQNPQSAKTRTADQRDESIVDAAVELEGCQQKSACEGQRIIGGGAAQSLPRVATNTHYHNNSQISLLVHHGMLSPTTIVPVHPFMDMSMPNHQFSSPVMGHGTVISQNNDPSISDGFWHRDTTKEPAVLGVGKCIPFQGPEPKHFQGDMHKEQNHRLPGFGDMINFPKYRGHKVDDNDTCSTNCVMCGTLCNISGKKGRGKTSKCKFTGNNARAPTIPVQNKSVCSTCDSKVWVLTGCETQIKWCKGCKNFLTWACFGMKGESSKCESCRERAKSAYQQRKKKLMEPALNEDEAEQQVETSPKNLL